MDNTFVREVAGRETNKWKAISSVIKLEKNAGISYVIS
jgi:hypothetical protein